MVSSTPGSPPNPVTFSFSPRGPTHVMRPRLCAHISCDILLPIRPSTLSPLRLATIIRRASPPVYSIQDVAPPSPQGAFPTFLFPGLSPSACFEVVSAYLPSTYVPPRTRVHHTLFLCLTSFLAACGRPTIFRCDGPPLAPELIACVFAASSSDRPFFVPPLVCRHSHSLYLFSTVLPPPIYTSASNSNCHARSIPTRPRLQAIAETSFCASARPLAGQPFEYFCGS